MTKPIKIKSDFEIPINFKNINESIIESVNKQLKTAYEDGFKDCYLALTGEELTIKETIDAN